MRQDEDLKSLHGFPEFENLFPKPAPKCASCSDAEIRIQLSAIDFLTQQPIPLRLRQAR